MGERHVDDLPGERWGDESGRHGMVSREAAVAVGAKDLGYSVQDPDPFDADDPAAETEAGLLRRRGLN